MLLCIEYNSRSMIRTSWYISLQNQARETELWVLSSLAQNDNDSETFFVGGKTNESMTSKKNVKSNG